MTRALLGGLLTYAIPDLATGGEPTRSPALEHADALVEITLRAVAPQ